MTELMHAAPFDTGPLSWVIGEIRESLERSAGALQEALQKPGDARATALQHAKTWLHQAHGAVQMVDVQGVGLLTQAAEEAIDRMRSGELELTPQAGQGLLAAYGAVTEYLDELLGGTQPRPVRLFPYYRELLAMLRAERIHPADLLFVEPDLQAVPAGLSPASAPDFQAYRVRFEKALLPFLRSSDGGVQAQHAAAMHGTIALVAGAQQGVPERAFWSAMQGFAELVAAGQLAGSVYVKQLFGQLNMQIRRLAEGQGSVPEQMLRDALFFIAASSQPTPVAQRLREAFHLEDLVPSDYEHRRYGRVRAEAIKAASDALAEAQEAWSRLAADADEANEQRFEDALAALRKASPELGAQALTGLLSEMARANSATFRNGRSEGFILEMASALLFIGHALEQVRQLPSQFAAHAATLGARLQAIASGTDVPEAPQWQADMTAQAQRDDTVHALAEEMKAGLRQVEKVLDDFYVNPTHRDALAEIDPVLNQLQGALAFLEQDDAIQAARQVREGVRRLAAAAGPDEGDARALELIAQNVGALGFFMDTLAHQQDLARDRFVFDATEGLLRAVPAGTPRPAAPATLAAPQVAMPAPAEVADAEPASIPAPAPAAAPAVAAAPAGAGTAVSADDDAELLEIFISEAHEVLEYVAATLPEAHAAPADQEMLTRLRRSFHTLKGSGRMVGLTRFAEAAHAVEKVMNLWLAEVRPATADLLALLGHAAGFMAGWVEELELDGDSPRSPDALVAAAARVQEGQPFTIDGEPGVEPAAFSPEPVTADVAHAIDEPAAEPVAEPDIAAAPAPGDDVRRIGSIEVAEPLYRIYLEEAGELLGALERDFDDWRAVAARAVSPEAIKAAHTLTGTSATVGFEALREVAHSLEMALQVLAPPAPLLLEHQRELLDATLDVVSDMLERFAAGELAPPQPELVEQLKDMREQLARQATMARYVDAGTEPGVDGRFDEAYAGLVEAPAQEHIDVPHDLSLGLPALPDLQLDEELDASVMDIFTLEPLPGDEPGATEEMTLQALPDDGGEEFSFDAVAGFEEQPDVLPAPHGETESFTLEALPLDADDQHAGDFALGDSPAADAGQPGAPQAPVVEVQPSAPEQPALLEEPVMLDVPAVPDEPLMPEVPALPAEPVAAAARPAPREAASFEPGAAAVAVAAIADDLDPDLLPVFMEEATDLLPTIGNALREWQKNPSDPAPAKSVQRNLHTVKGSARMAGAMRLGQHTHDIETQVDNMLHAGTTTAAAFDDLMANFDQALLMFEQLQSGGTAPAIHAPGAIPGAVSAPAGAEPQPGRTLDEVHAASARTPLVRVRADILDRLVNQAGEVAITRSKLETQLGTVKSVLTEFTSNLTRMSSQLRELEMQAESQIASRQSIVGEREFDPLEFDRFTRLQELTRMMAESVADVASFHETLNRSVDGAAADLVQQTRQTRELQQDLMRVRMVPFSSLSERLFRVARQAAKELDKRVNLDIRGGSVEMDRSVLEQMAGPFEHLLRNSIVHGVETRAVRAASGKPETGELLVQVSQQGNEVVLQFSDDGGGLDLARIRDKAQRQGLVPDAAALNDAQVADLVFMPGFSTADELTELAGRGVGMDVVRSEAETLGGRVAIHSTRGKGVTFTIHLPLTLAVTQVVPVSAGGRLHALPAVLVEQVLHMKEGPLQDAYAAGRIEHKGTRIPLYFLPSLLGDGAARPELERINSVLVLRSGGDRVAVHVDEIQNNREVVIKNIGAQLSRMAGIAGATVLGNGEIVLILNPVGLAQQAGQQPGLRGHLATVAPSVQVQEHSGTVMVVDDSLTVRRVTQRLLEREGYRVMLAKDGVDALAQMEEEKPDLMLVDIEMPRMDGFDLTRHVRGNDATRDIPIIMITSRTADKHRNYALGLGVNAYFGKPYQEPMLLDAIVGLLEKATT